MFKKISLISVLVISLPLVSMASPTPRQKQIKHFEKTLSCPNCNLISAGIHLRQNNGPLNLVLANVDEAVIYRAANSSNSHINSSFLRTQADQAVFPEHSNFAYSNFEGATLSNAHFGYDNLSGADFSGANMYGSVFQHCNLRGSNLTKSQLSKARICSSTLPNGKKSIAC